MKIARMIFRMALRNTFRNRRRTLLTLFILMMGSSGLLVIGGFFINLMDGFKEVFIHGQTGHIQVNSQGFYRLGATDPFRFLMPEIATLQRKIESAPHVRFTIPHLSFSGMASSNNATVGCLVLGVDADRERKMGSFQTTDQNAPAINIIAGEDLEPARPDEIIVGAGLLSSLGLNVGDQVSFVTTRPGGALDGGSFRIRGVFTTFIKEFDDRAMKINLAKAQEILGLPDQAQSLLVVLDQTGHTDASLAAIESQLGGSGLKLEILPWHAIADYYHQSRDLLAKIYAVIQLILVTVFVFSISNTVNMAILERTREFGTMMAIGGGRRVVFTLILTESLIFGTLGAGLGLLTGSLLSALVSTIGIELTPPQAAQVYVTKITLTPGLMLQTAGVAWLSAVIASVLPAIRISRTKIVEALGYV